MSHRHTSTYQHRQQQLWDFDELSELDALLITEPVHHRYLCGFSGSSAYLLVTREGAHLYTDGRYEGQAALEVRESSVHIVQDALTEAVRERLSEGSRVGFEAERLTVAASQRLREANHLVTWRPVGPVLELMRRRKDEGEQESIARAIEIAEGALAEIAARIAPGQTEREISGMLEERLRTGGSERLAFEPIVASGDRGALPHGRATDRVLQKGEMVTLDFGAVYEGYHADITRTWALGKGPPEADSWHEAVDAAINAALEAAAPGRPCREVDGAARSVIESHGFGAFFVHNLGHGLGLEVHEEPRLGRRSTDILEEGMVVTIEPGIYVPGVGGLRIEENVVIERAGAHLLTSAPRGLRAHQN
ncbi:M24 family metallopeptidase [Gemmatimonadota bacterium]